MPKAKERKLTAKQKAFAEAYTDPHNKLTRFNGTQSALEAYNTTDANTADSIASENLQKPAVLSYIEQINAHNKVSIEERSPVLAEAALGIMQSHTVTEQRDAEGNLISSTRVEKDITPAQRLRAIAILNDIEGVKNRRSVEEHAAKRAYDMLTAKVRAEAKK